MYKGKSFLSVITARGKSSRIRKKNLRHICGRPLFEYAAEAVKESGIFDRIIVSTDSQEIAGVAMTCGVEVPFIRPAELATADALSTDVMAHALNELGQRFDYVLMSAPTSPLVKGFDIKEAARQLIDKDADIVISITEANYNSAYHSFVLPSNYSLQGIASCLQPSETPEKFCLNGAIYIGRYDVFAENKNYYETDAYAYYMPPERSVDINTYWDLHLAECLLEGKERGKRRRLGANLF
jgi:N-acylneuraminate cytidylyltransferase/CMP-N,N'-diacetyllegionaminic acid synthase